MLFRSSQFRTFIALLMAVVVPFCCCNFHAWVSACASCVPAAVVDGDRHVTASEHDHHGCHHSGTDAARSSGDHHETPTSPGDGSDPHDCTCGKDQAKMMSGEKPTIDFALAVLVATLNWITSNWTSVEPAHTFVSGEVWACARPPTSLLRLHCALIV